MQSFVNPNRSAVLGTVILLCVFIGVGYISFNRAEAKTAVSSRSLPVKVAQLKHEDTSFKVVAERGKAHTAVIVQRTGLLDQNTARDPEIDSPYASDIILYNRHGYPIALSAGGNIPVIDPVTGTVTGMQTLKEFGSPTYINQAEQIEDLQSMLDIAKSLRQNPDIGEKFRWEIRTVESLAQWSLDHANDYIDGKVKMEPTPSIKDLDLTLRVSPGIDVPAQTQTVSATNYYIYQAYIRWVNAWILPSTWAQHSAVLVNVYNQSTGAFIVTKSSSNHGRDASDPTMTTVSGCPKAWGGRFYAIPAFQPYINTDNGILGTDYNAGGCGSPYGGIPGKHVCNDDSFAEYSNLKYDTMGLSWPTCSDSSLRTSAPTCY